MIDCAAIDHQVSSQHATKAGQMLKHKELLTSLLIAVVWLVTHGDSCAKMARSCLGVLPDDLSHLSLPALFFFLPPSGPKVVTAKEVIIVSLGSMDYQSEKERKKQHECIHR